MNSSDRLSITSTQAWIGGVQLAGASASKSMECNMEASLKVDQDVIIDANVDKQSRIWLGYQDKLREGVNLA